MDKAKKDDQNIYLTCEKDLPNLDFTKIFIGHFSHYLVECPTKKIDEFNVDISSNNGAICMPYYGYRGLKSSFKYNGPTGLGRDYEFLWDESY